MRETNHTAIVIMMETTHRMTHGSTPWRRHAFSHTTLCGDGYNGCGHGYNAGVDVALPCVSSRESTTVVDPRQLSPQLLWTPAR
eukprot:6761488-Pyramimonas_sp.AAC.1